MSLGGLDVSVVGRMGPVPAVEVIQSVRNPGEDGEAQHPGELQCPLVITEVAV